MHKINPRPKMMLVRFALKVCLGGTALPPDVRRGFAARCEAWLCRAANKCRMITGYALGVGFALLI